MSRWILMERDRFLNIVSRISRKKKDEIFDHLSLATVGISGSFGLSALRSLLENECNAKLPNFDLKTKINELYSLITNSEFQKSKYLEEINNSSTQSNNNPDHLPNNSFDMTYNISSENMDIGIDIQEIITFPIVNDYREDPFYKDHFSSIEISAAILKTEPRSTLCGFFCAKEAAKKTHPELLNLRMNAFLISYDVNGKPVMSIKDGCIENIKFIFKISITHSDTFAAATCLTLWENK